MKNRALLLGVAGAGSALLGILFILFGWTRLGLAAFGLSMIVLIMISLIIHRFLVKINRKNQTMVSQVQFAHLETSQDAGEKTVSTDSPVAPLGSNLGISVFRGGVGPIFEYAERAQNNRGKLETFALRTKSLRMRDVFSRAATKMQYETQDILRILRTIRSGNLQGIQIINSWDSTQLLTLARVMANQRMLSSDLNDSEVIFNAVFKVFGIKSFGRSDLYLYTEVLQELGSPTAAFRFAREAKLGRRDPVHLELLRANCFSNGAESDWREWESVINKLFVENSLAPVRINESTGKSALDSISVDIEERKTEGPLVSVIVPTFNGSEFISTTLDCLTRQTWKNIEILVVDDGSSKCHQDRLQEICAQYNDVRLLIQPKNLGAYPARNRALEIARGELITVHDDDDWSHPQKIELQATHLLKNPEAIANMTRHTRSSPELVFCRINNNPSFSQANFSSLMFRKKLLADIGSWDNVNRGGDAEFRDRIVAATGNKVEVLYDIPLSFTRTHPASLTAGEIGRGYIDPSRLFYQSSYMKEHRAVDSSEKWGTLNIAAPLNLMAGNRGNDFGTFDVVFATDFVFPGGTSSLTLNEIEAAADSGLRVGMINMFSPLNAGKSDLTARSLEVASRSDVHILSLKDKAKIDLLLIRHPSVLQFADVIDSTLEVEKAIVVVNNPPVLAGGKGYGFELREVNENAERIFGVTPIIMAESGVTRALTAPLVPPKLLSEETWPGFVNTNSLNAREKPDYGKKPVLGRHSRDALLKWPSHLQTYRDVYSSNDVFDVRIMGGVSSVTPQAQEMLKQNSSLLEFNEVSVDEFLSSVDFWAYFHSDQLTESFGMSIVEAMAKGLVVFLPEYMKANFGEGAVYCAPSNVKELIQEYWGDPVKYEDQSKRAREVAGDRFSKQGFLNRLTDQTTNIKL